MSDSAVNSKHAIRSHKVTGLHWPRLPVLSKRKGLRIREMIPPHVPRMRISCTSPDSASSLCSVLQQPQDAEMVYTTVLAVAESFEYSMCKTSVYGALVSLPVGLYRSH